MLSGLVGALVGLVASVAMVVDWSSEPTEIPPLEAARQFIDSWTRSKWSTYYVQSESLRVTSAGDELASTIELAQRPPDYVRRQHGGVDARMGERPVLCSAPPDGEVTCRAGPGSPTYAQQVAGKVARWEEYLLEGSVPMYRVETEGDGCFELHLTQLLHAPPYGYFAKFCFDGPTGAIIYTEIRRLEGSDIVQATEIRREVTAADLELPAVVQQ